MYEVMLKFPSGYSTGTCFSSMKAIVRKCQEDDIHYQWENEETLYVWWKKNEQPSTYYHTSSFRGQIEQETSGSVKGLLETSLSMYYKGKNELHT